ncbi:aminopeptidase NAALADL1 [Trichomycterus rosablanca]|uniref:aminopeptidase NAALADL1 n=1 Tax=Trichomycterus rosablanca TaxID=2290929 RepID=UPI002F3584CD
MLKKLLLFGFAGLGVFTIGILIGHFGIDKGSSNPLPGWVQEVNKDVDESFIQKFIAEVDNINIQENLRVLTRVPHMATSAGDEATVEYMLKRWHDKDSGLDAAWREDYRVYLSFPDKDQPNKVSVVNSSDAVLYTAREKEKPYFPEQENPDVVQPFAAFGPAGHAKGKLVYANQGKVSDYELLFKTLGDLNDTIAIVRYGGAGRVDKGINAAPFGVIGVLVYTEPYDINDGLMSDKNETYPHSWYLPPSGVERGSYKVNFGDQLTPYLAAKNGTYRIEDKDISGLSPIPIQPIGFEDAQALICNLGGSAAPADWQGSFPCTYNFGGPGFSNTSDFKDSDVKLDVYNKRRLEDSANVMGVIWGSVEPDRYVIYGNHRDSWVHGAVDPSSGTSVMLEISRILGQRVKSGKWRPRRTIIFGSWGAEEFGLIGSVEYAEEYITKLSQRTVAYINVDISVFANATLQASATPIAQNVIFTASKEVKIPGSDSVSVYKNWMQYSNRTSPTYGTIPNMRYLTGAGSDYAGFIHYLGITSMDISYTYDKSKTRARIYPAYHTAYDTFDYVDRFIDPGFTSHQTVARTAGNILIRLADSMLLPFNCSDYAETLEQYLAAAEQNFEEQLKNNGIPMEPLKEAVRSFRTAASSLDKIIHASDFVNNSPLNARTINDQLMLLDRAFLNPLAFPNKYGFRHVIWASRSSSVATFPGLADAVEKANKSGLKEDWAQAHRHLSIVTQAVSGAAHTLAEAHSQL